MRHTNVQGLGYSELGNTHFEGMLLQIITILKAFELISLLVLFNVYYL